DPLRCLEIRSVIVLVRQHGPLLVCFVRSQDRIPAAPRQWELCPDLVLIAASFWYECPDGTEAAPAHPVPSHAGRRAARLGRGRGGPRLGQGLELAEPSRIRMGEPGLAALDPVLLRSLPLRALRRARLRVERLEGRRSLVR